MVRRVNVLILCFLVAWSVTAIARSVKDGVYTKEQAIRGQGVYADECAICHGENLSGGEGAPGLVADDFSNEWNGKTVGDLFERIRKSMPAENPSSLSRQEYLDVTAYILSSNEYPAGQKELAGEAAVLGEIKIDK